MTAKKESKKSKPPVRVVIVTGLSGAGKSTALSAFEDMGFEAVDNLPISLLPALLKTKDDNPEHNPDRPLAIGIDSRTRAFQPERMAEQVRKLKESKKYRASLIFMDCNDEALSARFSETRRKHPLALDRPVIDGIHKERSILLALRDLADAVVDTSGLSIHVARRRLRQLFALDSSTRMTVIVTSFSFGKGLPRDADMVLDARFLRNPYYEKELRDLDGRSGEVQRFIEDDSALEPFLSQAEPMIRELLPRYRAENRSYFTLAFGCTGGRHRSVFLAERFAAMLEGEGYGVNVVHRELE